MTQNKREGGLGLRLTDREDVIVLMLKMENEKGKEDAK